MIVEKIQVGDLRFYYTRMDAFKALEVFGDLQHDFLSGAGGAFSIMDADTEASLKGMESAFKSLSTSLKGDQLRKWANLLLDESRVSVELADGPQRLNDRVRREVFTDFTLIIELMVAIIMLEFKDPLVAWSTRTGVGQKLQGVFSALTQIGSQESSSSGDLF